MNLTKHSIFILLISFISTLTLTSCCFTQGGLLYAQTQNNIADATCRVKTALAIQNRTPVLQPSLVVKKGMYVDRTPINLYSSPCWLRNNVVIRGDNLPFSYFSRMIVGGYGPHNILTRNQVGLDPNIRLSMNYSGSIKGALDLLAARSGTMYSVNGNSIYWQAFVTRTFDIAFMPGRSDYLMGKATGGSSATPTGSLNSAGGAVAGIIDDSASNQYSNLKGTLSIWADLEASIRQLLSPEGRVVVSEATSSVTVRDRPTNVELISQFICNFNNSLSRQVLVKVQILEVNLNTAFDFGIDWDIIQSAFNGTRFAFNANFGVPISITPLAGGPVPQIGLQRIAGQNGIGALIRYLQQQGKVSVLNEPRIVTQNNQVGVVRILNQSGYIASIQNTTVAGAGGAANPSITSQITPGTVVTGVTLYILPKILGDKVYLQVNADISAQTALDTLVASTNVTNSSIIQAPRITQRSFNQRSVIGNGDTLILSGFRQIANNTGAMQFFGSQALGGRGAQQQSIEMVVLITPIILHGYA